MVKHAAFLLVLLSYTHSYAQKATVSFFAGGGMAYVKTKGQPRVPDTEYEQQLYTRFSPVVAPQLTMRLAVPVVSNISFETGIGYERRGYRQLLVNRTIYPNKSFHLYENFYTTTIDYIRIPIAASYRHRMTRMSSIAMGVGMDYGFAFSARQKGYFTNSYSTGESIKRNHERKPEIKLLAGENRLINNSSYWADYFLFDVAFAFNVQYSFKERILLRLSQSYSLYAHESREQAPFRSRLRYSGISIGYRF